MCVAYVRTTEPDQLRGTVLYQPGSMLPARARDRRLRTTKVATVRARPDLSNPKVNPRVAQSSSSFSLCTLDAIAAATASQPWSPFALEGQGQGARRPCAAAATMGCAGLGRGGSSNQTVADGEMAGVRASREAKAKEDAKAAEGGETAANPFGANSKVSRLVEAASTTSSY